MESSNTQYVEIREEQLSYFSCVEQICCYSLQNTLAPWLLITNLNGRHILSSHLTSIPVNICHTLHHTWIDKKMFPPDPVCDSDASLPLIPIVQGQRVDRWPYEEWPSPMSSWQRWWELTSDTFCWLMVHVTVTSNMPSTYCTVQQIGPYELFGDVRWGRRGWLFPACVSFDWQFYLMT